MYYQQKILALANMLRNSNRTFALTGAGISTESGIPDFRSPGTGLWTKHDPIKVATVSALLRDPATFYRINLERWIDFTKAKPNAAHYALARLERDGLLAGVITQNIDGLHLAAGSQKVWEVHGHLRTCHCLHCGESYSFDHLASQYRAGTVPPVCDRCRGVLRPDVVLFEDPMGEDFLHATRAMTGCNLLLVIGSSLQVYPVASLPERARQLVIINEGQTPWDQRANLVINGKAGQVMTDLLAALDKE
ncbi:MAG TPA: NAD-dependent deacylase [Bacillota bacterium]|nr:NAD-dependent deacylase [Peptococcaceae bacterium MAG4]HPU35618.1 NAD-dependent deacylase [Bacillota bacterium]HPZ42777.1 NAD-dependent deacylase [Bacillota bacterium]HQD75346.1 NAD-dependent deacylase [Bacillota bacterium]HUM58062.1 NAD-dependent deacylase [Bacillota bacterium]